MFEIPLLLKPFIKPLAWLALAGALIIGFRWHESKLYQSGYAAAMADRKTASEHELARATAQASDKERVLREQIDTTTMKRQQEKVDYEKTIADLTDRVRRGDVRLRAPGACGRVHADPAPTNPGTADGPVDQEGFDLLPETAQSVLDAARELRDSVQDRNALIDEYNRVRAICNAP